jgi:NAD(P)-dependent dehydrogenase (short-subunit alcohol dehydrogenase family)
MSLLEGRVGLITGAARGIGRAYAVGTAAQGARLALTDVEDLDVTLKEVEAAGGEAIGVSGDVTDAASMRAVVDAAVDRFGTVDFLVNNAAIYSGLTFKPWTEISDEEWDRVMAVNVRGMFAAARAVAPVMTGNRAGKIINISSASALVGTAGVLHYVTSKGAIIAFTRALARELGDFGVTVNTITPGFTMSEASKQIMTDSGVAGMEQMIVAQQCVKRPEQPEDLVGTVVFLASPLSDFITGQIINVDGGVVMT